MAPSRKTISGLAPKRVSHALANADRERDLSLTRRSEKELGSKTVRAKLANTTNRQRCKKTGGGNNANDSQTEEAGNEDSDESDEQDDHIEEDDDPEAFAPSGGRCIKDHKLRNDIVSNISTAKEADNRRAGLYSDSRAVRSMTPYKKKRTFSNVSILTDGDDSNNYQDYPRKKVNRRLSDNNGRLVYDTVRAELKACMNDNEDAIMASEDDDDDDIYAILDEINESHDDDTSDELEERAILAAVADSSDDQSIEDSQDGKNLSQSLGFGVENDDILPLNDEMYHELEGAALFDRANDEDQLVTEDEADSTPNHCGRKKSNASARRVRFDDDVHIPSSASSSSSSSDIFEGFPDLLSSEPDPIIPQEQLDPFILQQIEDAHQDAERGDFEGSDSGSSYWDFGESLEASIVFPGQPGSASEDEGSGDSETLSGYDCKLPAQRGFSKLLIQQLMVTLPMMTSQLQLRLASQEPIYITVRHRQELLNLHIQSHPAASAGMVPSWALLLSMTQNRWPCSITAPRRYVLIFLGGPPVSFPTVPAQQAPVQTHPFKAWTFSAKCPHCFQLRPTS